MKEDFFQRPDCPSQWPTHLGQAPDSGHLAWSLTSLATGDTADGGVRPIFRFYRTPLPPRVWVVGIRPKATAAIGDVLETFVPTVSMSSIGPLFRPHPKAGIWLRGFGPPLPCQQTMRLNPRDLLKGGAGTRFEIDVAMRP